MATISSEFATPSTTNTPQFQHYGGSLIPSSNADQQRQLALQQARIQQLQNQQKQLFLQQQKHNMQANGLDPLITSSSSTSPTPSRFSPDVSGRQFTQSTPEKPSLSPLPPSPADSGVVADAKSESGNVSQEILPNFEPSKLEDSLEFMSSSKSPVNGLSFGATTSSSLDKSDTNANGFQCENTLNGGIYSLGLSTSNSNFVSDVGLGVTSNDDADNSTISMPHNIAAIWATPTTMVNQDPLPLSTSSEEFLQALQQQQQLNRGWSGNGITNPPPGLHSSAWQKQLQQQQNETMHLLQQQLALRRSQAALTQPTPLNRSISHQPGYLGGFGNLNAGKMNGFLPTAKSPSLPSWSNGPSSLSSAWPAANSRSTLFNSLQHGTSANRLLGGSAAYRKQSLSSQIAPPPRLNRSISTPAKYSSYMNNPVLPTSLDDNPFFKMSDAANHNGLMSFSDNPDNMGLSSLESQIFDIIRSSENSSFAAQNFPRTSAGFFPRRKAKWTDMNSDILFEESPFNHIGSGLAANFNPMIDEFTQNRFSRKVFVGGLPPDIDEDEIKASFIHFGPLQVDWPHKAESKSYFPPKGYAFLLFQEEISVQNLISRCIKDGDKLYLRVSSPTIREKPVQIRPWNLADSDFVLDRSQPLDPRKTIFVGGVPRPLRAVELAMIMDRLYGGVCYAGIDVDPELKYPKGAGRVAFTSQQSYIAAISARFVQLQLGDIDKRVEVKPYVLDDQHCDECQGSRCGGKFAPFFCANVTCLQYYCENCWTTIHARSGRELHKPLVKEGADRTPRSMPFRW